MPKRTIVVVDRGVITENCKNGTNNPALYIKGDVEKRFAHKVTILDKEGNVAATVVYDHEDSQNLGNRAWIETTNDVIIE